MKENKLAELSMSFPYKFINLYCISGCRGRHPLRYQFILRKPYTKAFIREKSPEHFVFRGLKILYRNRFV